MNAMVLTLVEKMNEAMRNPSIHPSAFHSVMEKLSHHLEGEVTFGAWMDVHRRCMQGVEDRMAWWGALETFALDLLASKRWHVYLHGIEPGEVPWNEEGVASVSSCPALASVGNHNDVSVVLYKGEKPTSERADLFLSLDEILAAEQRYKERLQRMDYFQYDRFYLQAKLRSLACRTDIQTLVVGSSYAMCGLREQDFPFPVRSLAVDAQDIHHTIRTTEEALVQNPSIRTVVMSFAPYLWGVDLRASSSPYNQRRVRDVNEPLFASNPPRVEEPRDGIPFLIRHLFLDAWMKRSLATAQQQMEEGPYFRYPRDRSDMHTRRAEENETLAASFAAGHNKFCRYKETVEANGERFHSFVSSLHQRGIKLVLFTPPMSPLYRPHLSAETIACFHERMDPLTSRYGIPLHDLTHDDRFTVEDFYDFDHVNDRGAQKLCAILSPFIT